MSRFSHDDYTRAMLNLLPSGIAWNRLPDSVQYRLIRDWRRRTGRVTLMRAP
nr:hypothetical protein [Escherichia coli]